MFKENMLVFYHTPNIMGKHASSYKTYMFLHCTLMKLIRKHACLNETCMFFFNNNNKSHRKHECL